MTVANRTTELLGINIAQVTAAPLHEIGHAVFGNMAAKWIYGRASVALNAGDFITFNNDYAVAPLTNAASPRGAKVGVTPNFAVPANSYAWFQTGGQALARAGAAIAAGSRVNTTASPAIDDDGTVGAKTIDGIAIHVAIAGAGLAEMQLSDPTVGVTI